MTQNSVVTLFRMTQEETLFCMGTVPAWVVFKDGVKNDGFGVCEYDRFDVRIKAEYIRDIKAGDYIFFGRAESSCADITECKRVGSVVLNKCTSFSHWHLKSE